ncbi:hypothetical protein, partial [Shigella flexneri]|uniref:hypothetical protein n=1 Tax=Shigella flexneri TaxID=623 RepID=UPI001C0A8F0D
QSSASSLSSGEYLPGSLQGKISSDGCSKKEQMVVSAIASTPQLDFFQHIHDVKRLTGNDDFRTERNRNAVLSDITPVCRVNDKSR